MLKMISTCISLCSTPMDKQAASIQQAMRRAAKAATKSAASSPASKATTTSPTCATPPKQQKGTKRTRATVPKQGGRGFCWTTQACNDLISVGKFSRFFRPLLAPPSAFLVVLNAAFEQNAHKCGRGEIDSTFAKIGDVLRMPPFGYNLAPKTLRSQFKKLRSEFKKTNAINVRSSGTDNEPYNATIQLLETMAEEEDDLDVSFTSHMAASCNYSCYLTGGAQCL
jgi:hypothetical protein